MITGELKNRIDSLWEIFWTGGLTNPLDVIEQMTYLMFIHDLDVTDNLHAKESAMLGLPYESVFSKEVKIGDRTIDGTQFKWSVFRDYPADRMYSVVQEMVFPFIKNLHANKESAFSKYMDDAIFKLPTPLMLSKVVDAMDELYTQMVKLNDSDARGDVYEYLLSKLATAGVGKDNNTQKLRVDGVKQPVAFYLLDVILVVEYRVNSQRGIAFRKWANSILKQYIVKGYNGGKKCGNN